MVEERAFGAGAAEAAMTAEEGGGGWLLYCAVLVCVSFVVLSLSYPIAADDDDFDDLHDRLLFRSGDTRRRDRVHIC